MNNIERYDDTIKYAIMNIVDAVNKIESMKTNEYLAMHPYAITHSQDTLLIQGSDLNSKNIRTYTITTSRTKDDTTIDQLTLELYTKKG